MEEETKEPLSMLEEAKRERILMEEANKKKEALLDREEKLISERVLGGDSGGHVEAPKVDPEDIKKKQAAEFFKGTSLQGAIEKL